MRTISVEEKRGFFTYLIFFQSKGGWPEFKLYETLEESEIVMRNLKGIGLKPKLYLDLTKVKIMKEKK